MTKKKLAIGLMTTYLLMMETVLHQPKKEPLPVKYVATKTTVQLKLERYIGDKHIAEVISKTKYPVLIAAIAKVESDYRPQIRGDNGESWGMYQIQPKHHGWLGDSIEDQTKLCERIVHGLLVRKRIDRLAIAKYNGSGVKSIKYAVKVIKVMKDIESC